MDIRVLKYFLAVAREGNITRAAETLHMTQPALSRQLRELEEELGRQLLIRGSKRVTLTEDGRLLRRRAEELVDLLEKTRAELMLSGENTGGDIYIGGGETDAMSLLAEAAEDLRQKYPLIRYYIYSGDASRVTERLDKGLLDFGLLVEPVDIAKYHYIRLPVKDTWGVLMRRDSPLAEKEAIRAEDLREERLLVSHQIMESSEMLAWFQMDISKLNIVAGYELIYNATHFVRKGFGYALALDKLINTTGESELCFRPLSPPLEAGLCLVWKKHQVFSRASELFLKQLQSRLSSTAGE